MYFLKNVLGSLRAYNISILKKLKLFCFKIYILILWFFLCSFGKFIYYFLKTPFFSQKNFDFKAVFVAKQNCKQKYKVPSPYSL